MRSYGIALAALVFGLVANTAFAQKAGKTSDTEAFIKKSMISNEFEVQSSKVAADKATNPELQKFAKQMVEDHTAIGAGLKEALNLAKVKSPREAQKLDEKHQKMMKKLMNAKGDQFNQAYKTMQEQAHTEAVKHFESYAQKGDNEKLREFASAVLPTLQKHLTEIKNIVVERPS